MAKSSRAGCPLPAHWGRFLGRGGRAKYARSRSLIQTYANDSAANNEIVVKKSPSKRVRSPAKSNTSPAKRQRAASPAKAASAPISGRARSKSPAKGSVSQGQSASAQPYPRPYPSHPGGRGKIISPTNPPMVEELNKRNTFHETLPAPELWHRNMPPYFPFGETPFMEQEISRQIDEDLRRG